MRMRGFLTITIGTSTSELFIGTLFLSLDVSVTPRGDVEYGTSRIKPPVYY
jgi:hypothetical protein